MHCNWRAIVTLELKVFYYYLLFVLTRNSSQDENTRTWRDLLLTYLRLSIDIHWNENRFGSVDIYG